MLKVCEIFRMYHLHESFHFRLFYSSFQGKFRVDGFFIDGSNLPQGTPSGEYKLELVIDRKVDGKDILIFDMVWFATIQPIDA